MKGSARPTKGSERSTKGSVRSTKGSVRPTKGSLWSMKGSVKSTKGISVSTRTSHKVAVNGQCKGGEDAAERRRNTHCTQHCTHALHAAERRRQRPRTAAGSTSMQDWFRRAGPDRWAWSAASFCSGSHKERRCLKRGERRWECRWMASVLPAAASRPPAGCRGLMERAGQRKAAEHACSGYSLCAHWTGWPARGTTERGTTSTVPAAWSSAVECVQQRWPAQLLCAPGAKKLAQTPP